MMPEDIRVRCFVLPLSLVIALPLVVTPAAYLYHLGHRNASSARVTLELDLVATLKSLQRLLNGSSDGAELGPETPAAQSRPLRWGVHVRQNSSRPPSIGEHRDIVPGPQDHPVLLRPVPGYLRGNQTNFGSEGSGDDPDRRIDSEPEGSGEEGAPDVGDHRRRVRGDRFI